MAEFKQSIVNVAEICARNHIQNVILSPGSRSAPLSLAFLRHPKMTCRTIVDERSAGFVALGLAQQLENPVALVCTSGTAALNYGPAVAEAFYQQIPLIVFTADRPPEWIDQNDGQTIHQSGIYSNYCRGSYTLQVDDSNPDVKWHIERIISDAINTSIWPVAGPVQVNVPLREPLYPNAAFKYEKTCKVVDLTPSHAVLDREVWAEIVTAWRQAERRLIVAGMSKPNARLDASLRKFARDERTVVLCDVTSNLEQAQEIAHSDMILGTQEEETRTKLAPEFLLTFGGPVVSKNLKLFLRKYRPAVHWHLQATAQAIDTFQALTRVFPVTAEYFFENLAKRSGIEEATTSDGYSATWRLLEAKAQRTLGGFLRDLPHCEFSAVASILSHLPARSHLQLGNSFIIRLANFIGLTATGGVQVNSNRGTCGIDGTLGTAVGAAMATTEITTIILGDLAFYYDRNALWHDYLPSNLRIIIINNNGGGIFRIIDGPDRLPELAQHFEVEHQLTARNTAADHGLDYAFCDSTQGLEKNLATFFQPSDRPAILEVHTDKRVNVEMFHRFKNIMREIQ